MGAVVPGEGLLSVLLQLLLCLLAVKSANLILIGGRTLRVILCILVLLVAIIGVAGVCVKRVATHLIGVAVSRVARAFPRDTLTSSYLHHDELFLGQLLCLWEKELWLTTCLRREHSLSLSGRFTVEILTSLSNAEILRSFAHSICRAVCHAVDQHLIRGILLIRLSVLEATVSVPTECSHSRELSSAPIDPCSIAALSRIRFILRELDLHILSRLIHVHRIMDLLSMLTHISHSLSPVQTLTIACEHLTHGFRPGRRHILRVDATAIRP